MLDYLNSFQIISSAWVINIVGAVTGIVKIFSIDDVKKIRRLIYMVPVAAMLYYEIGCSKLSGETWITLAHAIIVQIFMHILVFVYTLIYHNEGELMAKFTVCSIAYCETDFFYYSYAISQVIFDRKYVVHATISCFVQYFLVNPIHMVLAFFYIPNTLENLNSSDKDPSEEVPLEPKEEGADENELEDDVEGNSEKQNKENIDEAGNPVHAEHGEEEEIAKDVAEPPKETEEKKPWTMKQFILFRFINQYSVCSVLGIIWSAIGIEMPKFMSSFVYDLEKSIIAASFFITGSVIADHPFKGAPIIDTVFGCIFHFIIEPLCSIAASYILGNDKTLAMYLLLANTCPTAIYGHMLSQDIGMKTSIVSYTYYWTSILVLPAMLIWVAIGNETKLFE